MKHLTVLILGITLVLVPFLAQAFVNPDNTHAAAVKTQRAEELDGFSNFLRSKAYDIKERAANLQSPQEREYRDPNAGFSFSYTNYEADKGREGRERYEHINFEFHDKDRLEYTREGAPGSVSSLSNREHNHRSYDIPPKRYRLTRDGESSDYSNNAMVNTPEQKQPRSETWGVWFQRLFRNEKDQLQANARTQYDAAKDQYYQTKDAVENTVHRVHDRVADAAHRVADSATHRTQETYPATHRYYHHDAHEVVNNQVRYSHDEIDAAVHVADLRDVASTPVPIVDSGVRAHTYPISGNLVDMTDRNWKETEKSGYSGDRYQHVNDVKAHNLRGRVADAGHHAVDAVRDGYHYVDDKVHHLHDRASDAAHHLHDRASDAAHHLHDRASETAHHLHDRASDAVHHVAEDLSYAAYAARERLHDAKDHTVGAVHNVVETVRDKYHDAKDAVDHKAHEIHDRVEDTAHSVIGGVGQGLRNVARGISHTARDAKWVAKETARDVKDGIRDTAVGVARGVGKVAHGIYDAEEAARHWVGDVTMGAARGVVHAGEAAVDSTKRIGEKVVETAVDTKNGIKHVAQDVAHGIRDTAHNVRCKVGDALCPQYKEQISDLEGRLEAVEHVAAQQHPASYDEATHVHAPAHLAHDIHATDSYHNPNPNSISNPNPNQPQASEYHYTSSASSSYNTHVDNAAATTVLNTDYTKPANLRF
eukprot:TRINITY_DN385_c1_g1_i1.p1 TRINITY_DN385_c1_g1~~TRINITY_DN385_c1_g1_i1.p1  ORF type:complete len:707 (-),score=105.78 TRINITY_DN385_c1_g1_i1:54-2174(-)